MAGCTCGVRRARIPQLALVIPTQLGYRQLLSVVTFAALWSVLAGLPVSWGVQARRGLGGLRSRTAR